jgi:hypothetical protein
VRESLLLRGSAAAGGGSECARARATTPEPRERCARTQHARRTNAMPVAGRLCVVTGANTGIGRVIATGARAERCMGACALR